jgi:hypothetical protein
MYIFQQLTGRKSPVRFLAKRFRLLDDSSRQGKTSMPHIRSFVRASMLLLATICVPAFAATLTVANASCSASGAGSLYDMLASAGSGDMIVFGASATRTVALAS